MRTFWLIVSMCFVVTPVLSAVEPVRFGRDVLPILADACFHCHGPDPKARKGDLRLDTPAGAQSVIVPGQPDASELVKRIESHDADEQMPPPKSNRQVSPAQIKTIRAWIAAGATWGKHWSFESPIRAPLPSQTANPIDAFVRAKLTAEGLAPAPEADQPTLLRRVSLDLIGLPPTPEETAAFVADRSPDAFAKQVDRLLASPRYGERMAWDWLDVARYADTNGYQGDNTRTMWPWRDWVVQALNTDLPFDRFTVEQLAGDLLPKPTSEQKLATGFLRNHMINGEGGRIAEENRIEYVMDQAETVATVWLGLTATCARCHDHKYDPLTQAEYYKLFAYFNRTAVTGSGGSGQTAPTMDVISVEQSLSLLQIRKELSDTADTMARLEKDDPAYVKALKAHQKATQARAEFDRNLPRVMVMEDMPKPRDTFILARGAYDKPLGKVTPGTPAILPAIPNNAPPNRLALAQWLTSREHPLTARVTVNRAWQTFFGLGLVKTIEDFGIQGDRPSHPELLDWLAVEFMESGWSVKKLHRLIVTSDTYRQSSKVSANLRERDPENRLLARGPRYRMPAWMLRDCALAASGLLSVKTGGPAVKPYQPAGIWEEATFGKIRYQQDHGEALYRRSLYIFWRRIVGPTIFFDAANRQTCSVKNPRTNTPLHALTLLNEPTYTEASRALAQLALETSPADAIPFAFRRMLGRSPTSSELRLLEGCRTKLAASFQADPQSAEKLLSVGESKRNAKLDLISHAALTATCSVILNMDEALCKQ